MDGFAVLQCNNPQKPRCRLAGAYYFAPQAYTAVGLFLSAERCGHDLGAPGRVDVRPFAEYLLFEIPGCFHGPENSSARASVDTRPGHAGVGVRPAVPHRGGSCCKLAAVGCSGRGRDLPAPRAASGLVGRVGYRSGGGFGVFPPETPRGGRAANGVLGNPVPWLFTGWRQRSTLPLQGPRAGAVGFSSTAGRPDLAGRGRGSLAVPSSSLPCG